MSRFIARLVPLYRSCWCRRALAALALTSGTLTLTALTLTGVTLTLAALALVGGTLTLTALALAGGTRTLAALAPKNTVRYIPVIVICPLAPAPGPCMSDESPPPPPPGTIPSTPGETPTVAP